MGVWAYRRIDGVDAMGIARLLDSQQPGQYE